MAKTVRKATLQDFDNVKSITEKSIIYGGFDYLLPEFEDLMTRHGGYVLEMDGQVAGFLAYVITDGGTSFIPVGGRIHDDYRNQGLFRFLMDAVTKDLCAVYPAISSRRMSIDTRNPHASRITTSHDVVCRGKHVLMKLDEVRRRHISSFSSLLESNDVSNGVVEMAMEDVCDVADSPQLVQNLFPLGYFLYDWRVYRFNRADVASLPVEHANFHCLVSFQCFESELAKTISAMTFVSTNKYGEEDGVKLDIDFHGAIDEDTFKCHLVKAMRILDEKKIHYQALQAVVPEGCEGALQCLVADERKLWSGGMIGLEFSIGI